MRDLGGLAGWLEGGVEEGVHGAWGWAGGGVEEDEEAWAVVLLGLGFFLGLLGGCLHLQKERSPAVSLTFLGFLVIKAPDFTSERIRIFASTHLVGLGLSVLRVVFLVGLCLCVLLRLLGLLVLLLIVHGLFFLWFGRNRRNDYTVSAAPPYWTNEEPEGTPYLGCLLGLWFRLGLNRFL